MIRKRLNPPEINAENSSPSALPLPSSPLWPPTMAALATSAWFPPTHLRYRDQKTLAEQRESTSGMSENHFVAFIFCTLLRSFWILAISSPPRRYCCASLFACAAETRRAKLIHAQSQQRSKFSNLKINYSKIKGTLIKEVLVNTDPRHFKVSLCWRSVDIVHNERKVVQCTVASARQKKNKMNQLAMWNSMNLLLFFFTSLMH